MDLEEKLYREEIELAPFWKRFFAYCIDFMILSLAFSLFVPFQNDAFLSSNSSEISQEMIIFILEFLLLSFAYEAIFLAFYGATFGKMAFKIRVISVSLLDIPNLSSILIRSLIKTLGASCALPYLFFHAFFPPFNRNKQALHDFVAKTIVIDSDA